MLYIYILHYGRAKN